MRLVVEKQMLKQAPAIMSAEVRTDMTELVVALYAAWRGSHLSRSLRNLVATSMA